MRASGRGRRNHSRQKLFGSYAQCHHPARCCDVDDGLGHEVRHGRRSDLFDFPDNHGCRITSSSARCAANSADHALL